ncbi:hypothetical protein HY492_04095 [Candidatus Woesearchaeota archaeon]|nr:hypothetical protein [Candidatus Woesearchaeota archaeon]
MKGMNRNDYITDAKRKLHEAEADLNKALKAQVAGKAKELRYVKRQLAEAKEFVDVLNAAGIDFSGKRSRTRIVKTGVPVVDYDIAVAAGLEVTGDLQDAGEALDQNVQFISSLLEEMNDQELQASETIDALTNKNQKLTRSYLNTIKKWNATIDRFAVKQADPTNGHARYKELRAFLEEQRLVSQDETVTYDHMLNRLRENRQALFKDSADQESRANSLALQKAELEDKHALAVKNAESKEQDLETLNRAHNELDLEYNAVLDAVKDAVGIVPGAIRDDLKKGPLTPVQCINEMAERFFEVTHDYANVKDQRDSFLASNLRMLDRVERLHKVLKGRRQQISDFEDCVKVLGKEYGFKFNESMPFTAQIADCLEKVYYSSIAHRMEYAHSKQLESRVASAEKVGELHRTVLGTTRAQLKGVQAENARLKARGYFGKFMDGIKSLFTFARPNPTEDAKTIDYLTDLTKNAYDERNATQARLAQVQAQRTAENAVAGKKIRALETVLEGAALNEVAFQKRFTVDVPLVVKPSDIDAIEAIYASHIAGVSTQEDARAYAEQTLELARQHQIDAAEAKAIVEAWSNHSRKGFMEPLFNATRHTLEHGKNGIMNRSTKIKWLAKKLPHAEAAKKLFE